MDNLSSWVAAVALTFNNTHDLKYKVHYQLRACGRHEMQFVIVLLVINVFIMFVSRVYFKDCTRVVHAKHGVMRVV